MIGQKKKDLTPHEKYLLGVRKNKIAILSWQIGILVAFIGFWELFTAVGWLDPFFMSSPSRIITTFIDLCADGSFFYHIGVTLSECLIGFSISMVLGSVIAILLWLSPLAKRISEPYLVVLNALPKIALGPLIII